MPPHEQNWIANLQLDFVNGPQARAFFGFLKRSPDHQASRLWRLYLSLDFDDYIEINEGTDLLGSVSLETPQNPLGGTIVWVKRTAILRRVGVELRQVQADFLRGELTAQYLGSTGYEVFAGNLTVMRLPTFTGLACTSITQCSPCDERRVATAPACLPGFPVRGDPVYRGDPEVRGGPQVR